MNEGYKEIYLLIQLIEKNTKTATDNLELVTTDENAFPDGYIRLNIPVWIDTKQGERYCKILEYRAICWPNDKRPER